MNTLIGRVMVEVFTRLYDKDGSKDEWEGWRKSAYMHTLFDLFSDTLV